MYRNETKSELCEKKFSVFPQKIYILIEDCFIKSEKRTIVFQIFSKTFVDIEIKKNLQCLKANSLSIHIILISELGTVLFNWEKMLFF